MAPQNTPHRSRKRLKGSTGNASLQEHAVLTDPKTNNQSPAFPLASFFWPVRKTSASQWVIIPLILMIVGLFRWCTGLWGYSGYQAPPMHGDYEAQRHWMEITTHLPASQWYFYDLQYWGLDYPPLTAYHSWILGEIGSLINPTWFALGSSRGIEEQLLKVFMRATVIVSEYLIYIPSAILLNRQIARSASVNVWEGSIALVAILMQPSIILVDHAHFQYNTVMLGFVLFALHSLHIDNYFLAAVFFVAALSFKQMALYYAPAIFFYLIGACVSPKARPLRFARIGFATILSFAAVLAPILGLTFYDQYRGINPPLSLADRKVNPLLETISPYVPFNSPVYPYILQTTQIIHRIFPFARGIFEDKVANFWNCIHIVHKLHNYPVPLLQRISLLTTIVLIQPACMLISLYPRRNLLPYAFASCAWGFFLASFQVHEKSVLLPLLPMTILLGGRDGLSTELRAWIGWANLLGAWTLYPLLKRDELRTPYLVLTLLWAYLLALPPTSLSCYFGAQATGKASLRPTTKLLHLAFYALMISWHIGEHFVPPPEDKPDLWVVLNVVIGAAGFSICYLWSTWQLILHSGVMVEWFGYRADQESKPLSERAKALPLNHYWSGSGDGKESEKEKLSIEESPKKRGKTRASTKSLSPTPPETRSTKSLSPTPDPQGTRRSPRKKKAPTPGL